MTVIARFFLALAIWALLTLSAVAQNKRGPSTPEERANAVKAARLLEAEPFYKDAKKIRGWLTTWIIEVPDISVGICTEYLPGLYGTKDKNYESELVGQMMFASAAFIIEHPDQAKDSVAVNLAGVEGTLRMYEAILKTKPNAKINTLDQLVQKREKGELKAYVEEIATTKCKGKKS